MNEQQEAVDALTQPVIETHIEDGRVIVSELPPLLVQLELAIRSSMGGTVSGASLASERNILDNDALYEFVHIAERIRSWCHLAGFRPVRDPMRDLLAWNDAVPDANEAYVFEMRGWERRITNRVTPSKSIEVEEPCPTCGALTWWDGEGAERPRPVVVSYLRDDPLGTVTAVCRQETCLATWQGEWAVRLLRAQVDNEPEALLAFLRAKS